MPQGQGRRPLDQYEVNLMEESKRNAKDYNGNFTTEFIAAARRKKTATDKADLKRSDRISGYGASEIEKAQAMADASPSDAMNKARLARLKKAAAAAASDASTIMNLKPGDTINSKSKATRR